MIISYSQIYGQFIVIMFLLNKIKDERTGKGYEDNMIHVLWTYDEVQLLPFQSPFKVLSMKISSNVNMCDGLLL